MRLPRSPRVITVSVAAAFLSLGGVAVAATATSGADPVGPDATGHALFGLCTAYVASEQAHPINLRAVPFVNLANAAVAAGYTADDAGVREYCAADGSPATTQPPASTDPTVPVDGGV